MWQVLLAAAAAGSGFIASRIFSPNSDATDEKAELSQTLIDSNHVIRTGCGGSAEISNVFGNCSSVVGDDDGVFRFSSLAESGNRCRFRSDSRKKSDGSFSGIRGFEESCGVVDGEEQKKSRRRVVVRLKKRRAAKTSVASCKSRFSNSKDSSLFGWGLGVGIMYMVSAGKAELNKLNTAVDETSKVVEELKSEVCKRKSMLNRQDSTNMREKTNTKKVRGEPVQTAVTESSTESRDYNGAKVSVILETDDGDYASSVLTEEPEPELLEMNRLEAELESEFRKLPWYPVEPSGHEGTGLNLGEIEVPAKWSQEPKGQRCNSYEFHGVSPSELDQKLSHLLIKQQDTQIVELESELHLAHSKLHEKEAELEALKDCVRRLTDFSLTATSDEETEVHIIQDSHDSCEKMEAEPKTPMVVGMKRCYGL